MKKRLAALLLLMVLLSSFVPASAGTFYRVNTTWLKAHTQPKYSAPVADSYRRDFAAQVIATYRGGWAKVRFLPGGHVAYVQKKYLQSSSGYTAYITKDSVNLRLGPALSFRSSGKLNKGAKVTVLTHGVAFDYVSSAAGKGYIRNSCLDRKQPSGRTAFIRNPRNRTVNIRKGPGKKYRVLAEYRPGTKITVLSRGSVWSKVSVRGRTGYMMTRYISYTSGSR